MTGVKPRGGGGRDRANLHLHGPGPHRKLRPNEQAPKRANEGEVMPTFARLTGAVLLAALGVYAASITKAHLPDGEPGTYLIPVGAVMGAIIGWVFTGRHLEGGKGSGPAVGIGSAVLLAFWVAFLFAMEEMVDRSMRNSYGGSPTDALQDVFNILIDYARDIVKLDVVLTLAVGGLIVGVITAFVGKRFR